MNLQVNVKVLMLKYTEAIVGKRYLPDTMEEEGQL